MVGLVAVSLFLLLGTMIFERMRLGRFGGPIHLVALLSIFFLGGPLIRSSPPPALPTVAFAVYAAVIFGIAAFRLRSQGEAPTD